MNRKNCSSTSFFDFLKIDHFKKGGPCYDSFFFHFDYTTKKEKEKYIFFKFNKKFKRKFYLEKNDKTCAKKAVKILLTLFIYFVIIIHGVNGTAYSAL